MHQLNGSAEKTGKVQAALLYILIWYIMQISVYFTEAKAPQNTLQSVLCAPKGKMPKVSGQ
jgi:hypothetical protein